MTAPQYSPQLTILTPNQRERARRLGRQDTASELRLWAQLRGRRFAVLKFVRQLPVGPYVADIACRERMLIIEVDGATHGDGEYSEGVRLGRERPSSALRAPSPIALRREKGILTTSSFSRPKDGRRWPTGRMRALSQSRFRSGGVASSLSAASTASSDIGVWFCEPRRRTFTARSSISRLPTTRITGTFCTECSRTL